MPLAMPELPARTDDVGDERATLTSYLDHQRAVMLRKVAELDDDALRRSMTPSGLTLLGMLKHLAFVERYWFQEVFAGTQRRLPVDGRGPGRRLAGRARRDRRGDRRALPWRMCDRARDHGRGIVRRHRHLPRGPPDHAARDRRAHDRGDRPPPRARRHHARGDRRRDGQLTHGSGRPDHRRGRRDGSGDRRPVPGRRGHGDARRPADEAARRGRRPSWARWKRSRPTSPSVDDCERMVADHRWSATAASM